MHPLRGDALELAPEALEFGEDRGDLVDDAGERSTSRSGQLRRSPRSRRGREGAQGPDREVVVAGARPGTASGVQNLYGKSNLRHFAVFLLRFCCVVPKFVPFVCVFVFNFIPNCV